MEPKHRMCNANVSLRPSVVIVVCDLHVIRMFFRSQNGCGRQTAGSAGDDPEEEEEAGGEPRLEGQGGRQVQGKALNKWKKVFLLIIVMHSSLHAQVARKAKRADIFRRAEKFAKEYQDQERVRSGTLHLS